MNWVYIIGGTSAEIGLLMLVYYLTGRTADGTIKALEAHNKWLQQQVDQAKENAPDKVAERMSNRNTLLKAEMEELLTELEANRVTADVVKRKEEELTQSNTEIATLKEQMERAEELLGELEYFKEQFGCPTCGAELTTLAGEEEEFRAYACGNTSGANGSWPCPYDPEYPTLDEYDLGLKQVPSGAFVSQPKPKTKNACKLSLQFQSGASEEEVMRKIRKDYERFGPKKTKRT